MYLIDNNSNTDPALNLALEEYCFKHLPPDGFYLLFYINDPTVVVGKHQNLFLEANLPFLKEENIHLMRRISGGGTVYHDPGNLNFSFIAGFRERNLSHLPQLLHPIAAGLNRLGVPARINKKNDIVADGKKITGTAQHTDMKMVIHHGTLLFDARLESLREALKSRLEIPFSKGIASVRSPVANITDFLRNPMTMEAFKTWITDAIAREFGKMEHFALDAAQWEAVSALAESRYRSREWLYGRNPEFTVRHRLEDASDNLQMEISVKKGCVHQVALTPSSPASLFQSIKKAIPPGVPYDPGRVEELIARITAG